MQRKEASMSAVTFLFVFLLYHNNCQPCQTHYTSSWSPPTILHYSPGDKLNVNITLQGLPFVTAYWVVFRDGDNHLYYRQRGSNSDTSPKYELVKQNITDDNSSYKYDNSIFFVVLEHDSGICDIKTAIKLRQKGKQKAAVECFGDNPCNIVLDWYSTCTSSSYNVLSNTTLDITSPCSDVSETTNEGNTIRCREGADVPLTCTARNLEGESTLSYYIAKHNMSYFAQNMVIRKHVENVTFSNIVKKLRNGAEIFCLLVENLGDIKSSHTAMSKRIKIILTDQLSRTETVANTNTNLSTELDPGNNGEHNSGEPGLQEPLKSKVPVIAGCSALLIVVATVTAIIFIRRFKLRRREEPAVKLNGSGVTYAEIEILEITSRTFKPEETPYTQIVGVLKPK